MTYEIVKKLQEAGFQRPKDAQGYLGNLGANYGYRDGDLYYHPTLSELINACNNQFYNLLRGESGGIFATTDINGNVNAIGSTPEEAVARLWLKINQK